MKKIIAKPHLFFFGLAIVFMLLGIFINPNKVVDINLNALYVVISYTDWCYFSTLFFCLIGLNYFSLYWANRPPKKYLTIIHISFQILSILFLFTRNHWNWIGKQNTKELSIFNETSSQVLCIAFLIFIASIFIHCINFFTSLFLKTD
jgi:hypothetical protein